MTTFIQHSKRVLAIDPGTKNAGLAILQLDCTIELGSDDGPPFALGSYEWSIQRAGMLENPISDMKRLAQHSAAFYAELSNLMIRYRPDGLAAERFQTRGNGGTTIECVNAMLGIMSVMPCSTFTTTRGLMLERPQHPKGWANGYAAPAIEEQVEFAPMLTTTASTWKNSYNRVHDIDHIYSQTSTRKNSTLTPHTADAILIAAHALRTATRNRFNLEIPQIGPKRFAKLIRKYHDTHE
ncbi:hypothetical protein KDW67_34435 [Burkholderia cenocepacia]|uniref:hypothetical protein n=1 Tax=Burkholderia cenocepacia TaxID=95486 RepID=UPI00097C5519|nr:hypothetical protein [Burkholderia cenocepacia]AQQ46742.1 hypothetical protein A8F32_13120 [Burkholderia cenocepacia]MBR8265073.1 hypothetical protein [Burkholderia cenocepacia]ONI97078.1 hypothetical protein A8F33_33235 [Burkholderia cenocepacia]ONJ01602.1 hypothetical protein A8F53_16460 [Burkholderia cenocepacia]ONJ33927.1 hypothetical protein A8F38_07395 [Burkholderia cenocepacia]